MYYPYLRGKQFDLLALKEALSRGLLSNKIQPVIEPVRDSATLKNVIELFQKK
ncbi:sce7725 family protein, partial [Escherichia coli]|uniref:sce7725 family protein n=3 Tax=Bacteria TaxID=2 RepID=UPI003CF06310